MEPLGAKLSAPRTALSLLSAFPFSFQLPPSALECNNVLLGEVIKLIIIFEIKSAPQVMGY